MADVSVAISQLSPGKRSLVDDKCGNIKNNKRKRAAKMIENIIDSKNEGDEKETKRKINII